MACLKEKERANALNEVRLLASLASPYVITYKEAFFDEPLQLLCIVMEFAGTAVAIQTLGICSIE